MASSCTFRISERSCDDNMCTNMCMLYADLLSVANIKEFVCHMGMGLEPFCHVETFERYECYHYNRAF